MRLATLRHAGHAGRTFAARVEGDVVTSLPFRDVGELLRERPDWMRAASRLGGETFALEQVEPAPLLPTAQQVVCVGLNYRSHIAEMKRETPAFPTLFAKSARALTGARDPVTLPTYAEKVDYEAELAVVIGREVRRADRSAAREAIAGFTIMNDVSVRDWQSRTTQWWQGKNFERSTPLGPALVTPDEAGPHDAMTIECELDGHVVQRASCGELVFDPVELVSYVSQITTLVPGDVIATGTPGGVASGSAEPRWIREGSVLTTRISGLGECRNEFLFNS